MTDTHPTTRRDDAEVVEDDTPPPPGRPVRLEPTPPGFWRAVGGAVLAVLAPFFGILIGSTMGNEDPASRMDPLYWASSSASSWAGWDWCPWASGSGS